MNIELPQSDLLNTVTGSGIVLLSSNQEIPCVNSGSGHDSFSAQHHAAFSNIKKPFLLNQQDSGSLFPEHATLQ